MRSFLVGLTVVSLTLFLPGGLQASTYGEEPGTACPSLGKVGKYRGNFVNCERVQGRLVWRAAPTQGFATGGFSCGSPLTVRPISYQGSIGAAKSVLRGAKNVYLRGLDQDWNDERNILLSAENCDNQRQWLIIVSATGHRKPEVILTVEEDWYLLGAGFDPARRTPIALLVNEDLEYEVRIRTGFGWTTIWSASPRTLNSAYLNAIYPQTGQEFLLLGTRQGRWVEIRVRSSFETEILYGGPGENARRAESGLGRLEAYGSSSGAWVCKGSKYPSIEENIADQDCRSVSSVRTSSLMLASASPHGDAYWLFYVEKNPFPIVSRIRVACEGRSLFSCASIGTGTPKSIGSLGGDEFLRLSMMFDLNFSKIVASRIPTLR